MNSHSLLELEFPLETLSKADLTSSKIYYVNFNTKNEINYFSEALLLTFVL